LKEKLNGNKLTYSVYKYTEYEIRQLEKLHNGLMNEAHGISQVRDLFIEAGNFDYV
jgi:hypothetical protein